MDLEQLATGLPELREQLAAARERAADAVEKLTAAQREADAAVADERSLNSVVTAIEQWAAHRQAGQQRPESGGPSLEPPTPLPARRKGGDMSGLVRGREAVRRVLQAHGAPMMQRDLVEEVIARGWIDPNARDPGAAIRVAARRLVEDGEVMKVGAGAYQYRASFGTPNGGAAAAAQEEEAS